MKNLIWILIAAFALTALGCGGGGDEGGAQKKDPASSDLADPSK